jgi:hypothetical protein
MAEIHKRATVQESGRRKLLRTGLIVVLLGLLAASAILAIKSYGSSRTIIIVLALLLLTILISCILFLPKYIVARDMEPDLNDLTQADLLKAKNDVRTALLQGIGGALLLAGAFFTWREIQATGQQVELSQRQISISQDAQITDRFTRAIDQLGSSNEDVRLGGIHALGRIAEESERDRHQIINIFAAYVRRHSSWPPPKPVEAGEELRDLNARAPDVQAILNIFSELDMKTFVDLSGVDLRKASFQNVKLGTIFLKESNLDGAILWRSNLNNADFYKTRLNGAYLVETDLRNANLSCTKLHSADLSNADLRNAQFGVADLRGANLTGAKLEGAKLSGVRADGKTKWPAGFNWRDAGVDTGAIDYPAPC